MWKCRQCNYPTKKDCLASTFREFGKYPQPRTQGLDPRSQPRTQGLDPRSQPRTQDLNHRRG